MVRREIPIRLDRIGRNSHNMNYSELYKLISDTKSTLSDLVLSSGGDSNLEVIQARGGYKVLSDRLDSQHNKLEKQMNINTQKLSVIGNMNPKGAYETLAKLEGTHPSGEDGVFIVQEDGNWYYWNDQAWVSGGIYQAQPYGSFMTTENKDWVV